MRQSFVSGVAGVLCLVGVVVYPLEAASRRLTVPGQNVQVSHDRFAAHAEPSLAVNPRQPRDLLGAAQLIASTRETAVLGSFISQDGGRTWHDNGPLPLPRGYTHGDDVTVAFTARGTGLVAAEVYQGTGSAVVVWRTTDGGHHFAPPLLVYHTAEATDHPWIAASPTGERAYLAWSARTRLLFSVSGDDGRTFSAPHAISASTEQHPDWAVTTAGPADAVHVVYEGDRGPFEVASSSDGGRTFGAPVAPGGAPLASDSPGLTLPTLLAAATDPHRGTIVVARAAYLPRTRRLAILLWWSTDGGRSWPAPVRVDSERYADRSDHIQPQVVVDGTGTVDITYFALAQGRVAVYLSRCIARGAPLGTARRISSVAFDPTLGVQGGKSGPWWIGDYQGLAAGPAALYPFWNDTRTGRLEIFTAAVPVSRP